MTFKYHLLKYFNTSVPEQAQAFWWKLKCIVLNGVVPLTYFAEYILAGFFFLYFNLLSSIAGMAHVAKHYRRLLLIRSILRA